MSNNQLDSKMMEAVDSYGSKIKTLKDFMTAVRKRPTMYLGKISKGGLLNAQREIFQNSIDQIVLPSSPATWFSFHYNEITKEVIVEDNGLGLPADDIIRILTSQHTSKNYDKKPGDFSSGYNGVGSKIVNALSKSYIVESYKYDGTAVRMEFKCGYPVYDKPKSIPNKEKKQGLKTSFIMDETIMGDMDLEWKESYKLIKRMLSTLPIGTTCYFSAVDIRGNKFTEEIINKDGIITDLISKVKNPINKPIIVNANDGFHKLECAFCYDSGTVDSGPEDLPSITSFANMCPTIAGTHVDGVLEGISRWFSNYMNNIYLANQKSKVKLKIIPADIKSGLNVFISAFHLEPQMNDQAKEIMGNEDMVGFCKEVVMKGLDDWAKSSPQDLAKLSRFFKDIAEVRVKAESSKAKIVTKYQSNVLTGLPQKYVRPTGKDWSKNELIIVEGDSALGTVQEGRDEKTQGLFPIRGKIINAFKCNKQTFFSNAEVQGITRIILGSDYKKGFDVKDCKVGKVIFLADADVDKSRNCPKMLFQ